jgi:hypothetical protein
MHPLIVVQMIFMADFVPEDDVPVIMNTKEPFEEPTPCTSHLAIHTIPGT